MKKNTSITDNETGVVTNNSKGINVQKVETSHNIVLVMFMLFLFLIIEAGSIFWQIERENSLKKDFEDYKVTMSNNLMLQAKTLERLVNSWGKD